MDHGTPTLPCVTLRSKLSVSCKLSVSGREAQSIYYLRRGTILFKAGAVSLNGLWAGFQRIRNYREPPYVCVSHHSHALCKPAVDAVLQLCDGA